MIIRFNSRMGVNNVCANRRWVASTELPLSEQSNFPAVYNPRKSPNFINETGVTWGIAYGEDSGPGDGGYVGTDILSISNEVFVRMPFGLATSSDEGSDPYSGVLGMGWGAAQSCRST